MDEKKKKRWLIVVAVVACAGLCGLFLLGIVAGVGVPAWMSSVRSANESATIYSLNTVAVEEYTYRQEHGSYGTFEQLVEAGALDKRFAGAPPVIDGYVFTLSVTPKSDSAPPSFGVNADPQRSEGFNATGRRHFYKDSTSGYTHFSEDRPATATDPVLEEK